MFAPGADGEAALPAAQMSGGLLVLGAVVAVQSRRPQLDAEAAPT